MGPAKSRLILRGSLLTNVPYGPSFITALLGSGIDCSFHDGGREKVGLYAGWHPAQGLLIIKKPTWLNIRAVFDHVGLFVNGPPGTHDLALRLVIPTLRLTIQRGPFEVS